MILTNFDNVLRLFVNFDDGDVYGWTGEDVGAKVRRKVLVREETPEPGTKLLVVAAHYGRGPMRFHKWVRAEAVAPAAEDEKPAAWTLTSFCRHAFRHPEALEGYSPVALAAALHEPPLD